MALSSKLVLAVVLLASSAAWAAAEPGFRPTGARGRIPKAAVLEPKALGSVSPKEIEGLTSLVAAELSSYGMQAISGAELRSLLGFDRERKLLGCDDSNCIAEAGGALGVDYLVISECSKVGGTWVLSMVVLEMAHVRPAARAAQNFERPEELVPAARRIVRELGGVLVPNGPVAQQQARSRVRGDPLNWTMLGAGILAAGGGAVLMGSAWSTWSEFQKGSQTRNPTVTREDADTARMRAGLGLGLIGAGVALGGWSASRLLWPSGEASVGVSLLPGSAGVSAAFHY